MEVNTTALPKKCFPNKLTIYEKIENILSTILKKLFWNRLKNILAQQSFQNQKIILIVLSVINYDIMIGIQKTMKKHKTGVI
jgi:hypothetical protein